MIHVIYHKDCLDGYTAAAIVADAFKHKPVIFTPASYGDAPPATEDGDHVYIVDFSYPADILRKMPAEKIVVLDHHKTALDSLRDLLMPDRPEEHIEVIFDMKRSGCQMAWDYFNEDTLEIGRPMLVDRIGERDLWNFSHEWTKPLCAALQTLEMQNNQKSIENWLQLDPLKLVNDGQIVLRFQDQLIKRIMRGAYRVPVRTSNGYYVAVNSGVLQSEVGNEILERDPDALYADVWVRTPDGYIHSLRSQDHREDVSEIAKVNGGGGHRNAAGYKVGL